MARPLWTGTLSFGLLNVPVSVMPGERRIDLHFRMLDSRSNTPIRYERVNADTGEEVPWRDIVKAYEYKKGSYVVLRPEDIKSASPEGNEAVEVDAFVDPTSIGPEYFEKPYVLVPGKKAEKDYVLLRETLRRTGKIGIARVVIRAREYLSAVLRLHSLSCATGFPAAMPGYMKSNGTATAYSPRLPVATSSAGRVMHWHGPEGFPTSSRLSIRRAFGQLAWMACWLCLTAAGATSQRYRKPCPVNVAAS